MEIERKLTDMEITLALATHIKNPCGFAIKEQTYNVRDFYLRLARDVMPALRDSHAIEFLKSVIVQYE